MGEALESSIGSKRRMRLVVDEIQRTFFEELLLEGRKKQLETACTVEAFLVSMSVRPS